MINPLFFWNKFMLILIINVYFLIPNTNATEGSQLSAFYYYSDLLKVCIEYEYEFYGIPRQI